MSKDWDKAVPKVEIWKECLRVMKAGSFAFVMSAPRQDVLSHMIFNLEKAGFDTGFTSIYWTYASGFPKAMNISKAVDKRLGIEQEVIGTTKGKGGENLNKLSRPDGNDSDSANGVGAYGHGAKQVTIDIPLTISTSDEAKELDGSYGGFQPKPAVEIIIVAMKPLSEKTFIDQALKDKKGVTWLDDCRVPTDESWERIDRTMSSGLNENAFVSEATYEKRLNQIRTNNDGRFPANLLVSDDVLNDGQVYDGQNGATTGNEPSTKERGTIYGDFTEMSNPSIPRNDAGSFSRYYDLDKWWEERIKSLPENVRKVFPFLIEPKAAKSEKNNGLEGMPLGEPPASARSKAAEGRENPLGKPRQNFHPTVKPIKLMSYLIALGSREGDVILDPFIGSGTTALAAKTLSRNFIGIEILEEYHKIAEARLKLLNQQPTLF